MLRAGYTVLVQEAGLEMYSKLAKHFTSELDQDYSVLCFSFVFCQSFWSRGLSCFWLNKVPRCSYYLIVYLMPNRSRLWSVAVDLFLPRTIRAWNVDVLYFVIACSKDALSLVNCLLFGLSQNIQLRTFMCYWCCHPRFSALILFTWYVGDRVRVSLSMCGGRCV